MQTSSGCCVKIAQRLQKHDNNYVVHTYYSCIRGNEIYPLSLKSERMKNFLNFALKGMEDTMINNKENETFRSLKIANKFRTNFILYMYIIQLFCRPSFHNSSSLWIYVALRLNESHEERPRYEII